MVGLADRPRSGRPRELDHGEIVSATLIPPPAKLGVTHWSSRLLADHLRISFSAVAKAWREYGVQPWRARRQVSQTRNWSPRSPTWSGCL